MLVKNLHRSELANALDSVHNYYENQVIELLRERHPDCFNDPEMVADAACVALNSLPPRYVRYDVDMAFYLSPAERHEMETQMEKAVDDAVQFVASRAARLRSEEP